MSLHSVDADQYDENGEAASGSGEMHSRQVRMAYRLAAGYQERLLHVHGIGWHYYDGSRWVYDDRGAAQRAVVDVLRVAIAESFRDKELRADVARCETKSGIDGVLGVAASLVEFAATVRDLDADPFLLNCANGTLDLRTRELRPHDAADRLTKITTGSYRPDADASAWRDFLGYVLPDPEERGYLQRVFGQAAYGLVREHLFPVLVGEGGNGKGTTYETVMHALGNYATVINPEVLMARERGSIGGPELMELLGARLVIGSETGEGRRLDEATMKRLTGGDTLTARRLYRDPVTWTPTHQLVYVTNHLPKVHGNDPATFRRLRVVPFNVKVPDDHNDKRLGEKLRKHADAVLAWIVAGYFDYASHGDTMREPESVRRATDDYQADSDEMARFVAEACHTGPYAAGSSGDLYRAWKQWAAENHAGALSLSQFSKELDRLGYEAHTVHGRRMRAGIAAASRDDDAELWTSNGAPGVRRGEDI